MEDFGLQRSNKPNTFVIPKPMHQSRASSATSANIINFGSRAEEKPHLFVAMPFSSEFIDEFEIGFHEAEKANAFVCERLDLSVFTGDIVTEMQKRIVSSHGVIALLNGHNPNVFLEIGFALAYGKPIMLVARDGVDLPFDIRSHRCISYKNISELREKLTAEIGSLRHARVLTRSAKLRT